MYAVGGRLTFSIHGDWRQLMPARGAPTF